MCQLFSNKKILYFIFYLLIIFRSQIICYLGDLIPNELQSCWPILIERLKNEITRLTTVKAINMIAE